MPSPNTYQNFLLDLIKLLSKHALSLAKLAMHFCFCRRARCFHSAVPVVKLSSSGPGQVPSQVQKVKGQRTKDTINLVCHSQPPPPSKLFFSMTLRMTFKTWDVRGVFNEDFEGDFVGLQEGD